MIIQHNISALNANRQLGANNSIVSKNLEKLSSGFRINRAGDDAAGLAISEKMRSQIKGLETAQSNAQDGISLVQTAEGALTEVHSMLNRMVELATQSSNGTYTEGDRDKIQAEVENLKSEIDRISEGTNFNGINLLDGSLGTSTAKIGVTPNCKAKLVDVDAVKGVYTGGTVTKLTAAKDDTYTLTVGYEKDGKTQSVTVSYTQKNSTAPADAAALGDELKKALSETEVGSMFDIKNTSGALEFTAKQAGTDAAQITSIAGTMTTAADGKTDLTDTNLAVTETKAAADAKTTIAFGDLTPITKDDESNQIDNNIVTINGQKFAYASDEDAAKKLDSDVNVVITTAADAAAATKMSALIAQKTGLKAEENATTDTSIDVDLKNTSGKSGGLELQVGDSAEMFNKVVVGVDSMSAQNLGIGSVDISSKAGANAAIKTINEAIETVSEQRGELGAVQNRLEHTINNLGVTTENMTAAESRIRDVDMAKEMMNFTKNNVLTQAAQAMLAQANQQPQGVLQLLR